MNIPLTAHPDNPSAAEILKVELAAFEAMKDSLLESDPGRYAVFRGEEFAGCWDTHGDALQVACQKFGLSPFLIKQVLLVEPVQFFNQISFGAESSRVARDSCQNLHRVA